MIIIKEREKWKSYGCTSNILSNNKLNKKKKKRHTNSLTDKQKLKDKLNMQKRMIKQFKLIGWKGGYDRKSTVILVKISG